MPSFLLPLPPINSLSNLVKLNDITFNIAKKRRKTEAKKGKRKVAHKLLHISLSPHGLIFNYLTQNLDEVT
jgi:hypothetical protein